MVEIQFHGFSFEKWVRVTFFDAYSGVYMQKWDIPGDYNKLAPPFGGLPVSVKTAKMGSPIGLGDVLRQRSIDSPFLMIVGFWRQRTPTEKWFEEIGAVVFLPEIWSKLWGTLTFESISDIDKYIKNLRIDFASARTAAKQWKNKHVLESGSELVINPKIDSKTQRRIQCSLPFKVFWRIAGRSPAPCDAPTLFDKAFENPVLSGARIINREIKTSEPALLTPSGPLQSQHKLD